MNNSRKIALEILNSVIKNNSYSNIVLNSKLKESKLDDKDKALITEIVYGTLKHKYTIDKILSNFLKAPLEKQDIFLLNMLRMTIYQIKYLTKIPEFAAVNEGVELAKQYKSINASKLVNGVLRNYLRNKDKDYYDENDAVDRLCFLYSFEPWMVKMFIHQYGYDNTEKILMGLNTVPNLTVRINTLKTTYDEAFEKLKKFGYDTEDGVVCAEAIRIIRGKSIEQNPLFREGLITVQDESAMLVGSSMEIVPDISVLDLCSAPGGKATHIAELMNNRGKIRAFDIHKDKLSLIKDNAARLGITIINCDVMDAAVFNKELIDSAQRVLIDVPCSGLGIIRKKPEIKWTKNLHQLRDLKMIQRSIMENAASYVKKDGILLYSTCTINKDENEENIKWFLNKFNNYKIIPLFYGKLDNIIYSDYGVTILPNNFMDGFFVAKLKRLW